MGTDEQQSAIARLNAQLKRVTRQKLDIYRQEGDIQCEIRRLQEAALRQQARELYEGEHIMPKGMCTGNELMVEWVSGDKCVAVLRDDDSTRYMFVCIGGRWECKRPLRILTADECWVAIIE